MEAEAERRRAAAAQTAQKKARTESEFDAWWEALPARKKSAVTRQALEVLRQENRMVADLAAKRPDSAVVQETLRELHKRLSGWAEVNGRK